VTGVFHYRAEMETRAAFRTLGAISPSTARPGSELPQETPAFRNLLRRGVVREGAPGTFYLYEDQRAVEFFIRQVLFWIVVIYIPIALIQFCPGGATAH
jgi:hypothetical protein